MAIVNISSDADGLDDLEGIASGDHPWIKHYSFIRTDRAMLSPVAAIHAALRANPPAATAEAGAMPATVTRLQLALGRSRHTKREVKRILSDQGFIAPST